MTNKMKEKPTEIISAKMPLLETMLKENKPYQARGVAEEILAEKNITNRGKVYCLIGEGYLAEDNFKKALASLEKAVQLGEDTADNYYILAALQHHINKQRKPSERGIDDIKKLCFPAGGLIFGSINLLTALATSPYWASIEIAKSVAEYSGEKRVLTYLEEAVNKEHKKEHYVALMDYVASKEVSLSEPKKVVKYGQKALKKHPKDADIIARLSNAYHKLGVKADSYSLMMEAIHLKCHDGEFIRKHFYDRLLETPNEAEHIDHPVVQLFRNKECNNNLENNSIVNLAYDFFSEHILPDYPLKALQDPLFHSILRAKIKMDPENLEVKYKLAVGKTLEAQVDVEGKIANLEAFNEAVPLFRTLKAKGYPIYEGRYKSLTKELFRNYADKIAAEEAASTNGKGKLSLYPVK